MGKKATNIKPASARKPEPPPAPPSIDEDKIFQNNREAMLFACGGLFALTELDNPRWWAKWLMASLKKHLATNDPIKTDELRAKVEQLKESRKQQKIMDFEELHDRLEYKDKFSTYDMRKAKTFHNRVQTFNHPIGSMDNEDGKADAISILLQAVFPEGYEIWLYADGTWKLV